MKNISFILLVSIAIVSCGEESNLTEEQIEKYTEEGQLIAQASFEALSGNLKNALKSGGVANAVGYCNAAAMPLTDSLSGQHEAIIKRTSLKLRNPANAPNSLEAKMLNMYLIMSRMRNPIMVPKILEKNEDEIQFFAPIMINNETCLKCHGIIGQTMKAEDYAIIKKLYPEDEAIDYRMNKFRGMWSITLKR